MDVISDKEKSNMTSEEHIIMSSTRTLLAWMISDYCQCHSQSVAALLFDNVRSRERSSVVLEL